MCVCLVRACVGASCVVRACVVCVCGARACVCDIFVFSSVQHRYLSGRAPHYGPENTLLVYNRAVHEHKTQILEIDVQITEDNHLVLHHDGYAYLPIS